jgi:1-acyl-sn-glycerol-3-phosphate acyltransferase
VGALFPFLSYRRRLGAIKRWSRHLLAILQVHSTVRGALPRGHQPTLIVCNHVSWLDIWVIDAVLPVRFVAKSDVRRWPVIGFLVSRAGTIFVERRKRHDTARTNRAIVQALARGEYVAVFPEGTTTDGSEVRPYHASLFQPALGAGARVVVAALHYRNRDGSLNLDAHYEGERSLVESLRLILAHRRLDVELIFAGTVDVHGKTRRRIAQEAEVITSNALGLPRPGRKHGTAGDPPAGLPKAASPKHNLYPTQ